MLWAASAVPVRPFFFFHTRSYTSNHPVVACCGKQPDPACAAVPRTPEIVRNKQHNTTGGAVVARAFGQSVWVCGRRASIKATRAHHQLHITTTWETKKKHTRSRRGHPRGATPFSKKNERRCGAWPHCANRRPSNTTAATATSHCNTQQKSDSKKKKIASIFQRWISGFPQR